MDIDDILAEVDADGIPQETRDLQALTRAWVNERCAPEVLQWPAELMDRLLARIAKQVRSLYCYLALLYTLATRLSNLAQSLAACTRKTHHSNLI